MKFVLLKLITSVVVASMTLVKSADFTNPELSTYTMTSQYFLTGTKARDTNVSITIDLNSSVTLNCSENVTPGKTIWWFDSFLLFSGNEGYSTFHNVRLGNNVNTSQLLIDNFQLDNVGLYKCAHGSTKTDFYYLNLPEPIEKELFLLCQNETCPKYLNLTEGIRFAFQCFSSWKHPQQYIWLLNNITVYEDGFEGELPFTRFNLSSTERGSELQFQVTSEFRTVACVWEDHIQVVSLTVANENDEEEDSTERSYYTLLVILLGASLLLFVCLCIVRKITRQPYRIDESHAHSIVANRAYIEHDNSINEQPKYHSFADNFRLALQTCNDSEGPLPKEKLATCYFEQNVKDFGLRMFSLRGRDSVSELWDARLAGGDFHTPFVTRNLRDKASSEERDDFLKFQNALQVLSTHPNVLKAIGFRADVGVPYRIYYEFFEDVTLGDIIQSKKGTLKQRKFSTKDALSFADNIANGMVFLKLRGFDHVALRADRVLLFNGWKCKLFDFNLSSKSQKIAVRKLRNNEALGWFGPEVVILEAYNRMSDIWSFGVLLWELWSEGKVPHQGISREDLRGHMKRRKGLRCPSNCPETIFNVILSCWKYQPEERINFLEVRNKIGHFLNNPENIYDDDVYSSRFYEAIGRTANSPATPELMKQKE